MSNFLGLNPLRFAEQNRYAKIRITTFLGIQRMFHVQAVADDWAQFEESCADLDQWRARIASGAIKLAYPRPQLEAELRWQLQMMANAALVAQQDDKLLPALNGHFMLEVANVEACQQHAALDGFFARVDDPVWQRLTPPLSYGCRCARVLASVPFTADRSSEETVLPAEPARGFGFYPGDNKDLLLAIEWIQAQCDPSFDHPYSQEWPHPRHEPNGLPMMFFLAPPARDKRTGAPWQAEIDAVFDRFWPALQHYEPAPLEELRKAIFSASDKEDMKDRLGLVSARVMPVPKARKDAETALTDAFSEAIRVGITQGRETSSD